MILPAMALFGLLIPNGLILYWLFYEYEGISSLLQNRLALAFIMDAFLAMGLLVYASARKPIGRVKWYRFIMFSILGGLGCGIPFYGWLNKRRDIRLIPEFHSAWAYNSSKKWGNG